MTSLLGTVSRWTVAPASTSRLIAPLGAKLSGNPSAIAPPPSRRPFSSLPARRHVVISSVGPDRPGIVADVTRAVTARGGNVGESHSILLGGHFSLTMLVDVPPAELAGLRAQLGAGVGGMTTSCFDAADPRKVEVCPRIGFAGRFKLSGADNPGIVHKLTSALARNSLTIGNMKTSQEEAPFGGTELFNMEGKAVAYEPLSSSFDWSKIKGELQELGESMNCDVEFDDVTGSPGEPRAAA